MEFNWHLNPHDLVAVEQIVNRMWALAIKHDIPTGEKINLHMDLTACHNHGCPLDLQKLLKAPDFDFMHDVLGIGRHLNRETGQLEDCFLPRCARPE